MLNTQYNTPNVGLFKLFLLTHFVPCMQAQGKGRSALCPKGFYIFTIFRRMPGFESKMLRMQPGVLPSLVVQFSQISCHKMSSFKYCIIWQHILYVKDSSSIKLHSIEAWTQGWEFGLSLLLLLFKKEPRERFAICKKNNKSESLPLLFTKRANCSCCSF